MASRPPDDALARLARWDELRRRAAGARPAAADPVPVLDDMVRTLRELAERHPSLSLAVEAEDAGVVWRLHVTRTAAGAAEVVVDDTAGPGTSPATRLADLLREHPGILDP
jgi:hypothetical protein